MMKIVLFISFALSSILYCEAQPTTTETLKDSIFKKYVENGAYNYNYLTQEWQKYLDSAIAITPDNASLWQQKAMPYFKRRKYEIGKIYLDKAVELSPKRYIDYRGFMNCIFAKNYTDAIADFNKSKELKGEANVMDHSYDFYLGICYLQLNRLKEAEHSFQLSIDKSTKDHGPDWVHFLDYFYMGVTQYELEDFQKSVTYLNKCLAIYKTFADAKYYKARCLKKWNQKAEGDSLLKEAAIDLQAGHTFNEDNSFYEFYPYQISSWYLPKVK